MRLIDADALKKAIPNTHVDIFENCRNCRLLDDEQVKQLIDDSPTIELLKEQKFLVDSDGKITPLPIVVRCKDCKWHTMRGEMLLCTAQDKPHTNDWFCADGEHSDT